VFDTFQGPLLSSRPLMDFLGYLDEKRRLVDGYLSKVVPTDDTPPQTLHKAMRYSLFAGGKRVRPILAIAAYESLHVSSPAILPCAAAIELVHKYSLIHDDLPAMDNDDYRRGRLTNHKVFGEAMAILAGDALLTMAFDLISRESMDGVDPAARIQVVQELAVGAGDTGMVAGQVADIEAEGKDIDLATLEGVHRWKTGTLIRAAVRIGAILAGASPAALKDLSAYAEDIGLAFQIADDVLNVVGSREELGKDANTDASRGKKTYPAFFGVEGSRKFADERVASAIQHLERFDRKADPLRELARYITARKN
jgi:geranylgeranyl diphosphate synthase type II